ncbi:uncharacterized protein LOC136772086 [Amia ocellicauda]|uniref:uncharacterized protein LOC136772086 n=1 Tax=Amia ocellicauda TaxID=2972642 RepID=UPI0034641629
MTTLGGRGGWAEVRAVRPGDSVSLPCEVPLTYETFWFSLRSENITLLTTTLKDKVDKDPFTTNSTEGFTAELDRSTGLVSLRIEKVSEAELALYFCVDRDSGGMRVGEGIRLTGADSGRRFSVCWTVLSCVTVLTIVLGCVCVCLWYRPGCGCGSDCCVRHRTRGTQDSQELHYASLELSNDLHPSGREKPQDTIYSSVNLMKGRSHDGTMPF